MTTFSDRYTDPIIVDQVDLAAMTDVMFDMRRATPNLDYSAQLFVVDTDGNQMADISQYLQTTDASVEWDSTANIQNSCKFNLAYDLRWGSDRIAIYALIRGRNYNILQGFDPGAWMRFPMGVYIATTPGYDDLEVTNAHSVTGYGLNFLLQNGPNDSFAFDIGSLYVDAITTLFRATGIIGGSDPLSNVCDYDGDWSAKTLPTAHNYPLGSFDTWLDIINDLLKESGMRPIFVQQTNARWKIDNIPDVWTQGTRWLFAGSEDTRVTELDLRARTVIQHSASYSGDVFEAVNKWVFIQDGLSFEPVEGSGQYTYANQNIPPAGITQVGRVLRSTQILQASGQSDLQKQGDAIVKDYLASFEKISLQSCPWPVARNYDMFYFVHKDLPFDSIRRVQAQSWTFDLFGAPTQWQCNAVSLS